jgi:hypothetical protein
MFEKILKRFVVGRGRIPAVLVLHNKNNDSKRALASGVVAALTQAGLRTAQVQGKGQALLEGCRAQLMAPDLGAIVVVTDGADLLQWGLPMDRFDVLAVDRWNMPDADKQRTLRLLEHHVNQVMVVEQAPELGALQQRWGEERVKVLAPTEPLPQTIAVALRALADAGHVDDH